MKHIIFPVAATLMLLASCSREDNNNTETSIHARADSIVGARMQEINQRAMDDLEKRMTIEVKAKADSIVAVRKGGVPAQAKDTSATRQNAAMPVHGIIRHLHDSSKR